MLSLTNTREFRSAASSFGVLLIALTILSGCHSRKAAVAPSITFTRVPQATLADPDKLDIIQGRVEGAHPGQQIVLYRIVHPRANRLRIRIRATRPPLVVEIVSAPAASGWQEVS